jgi:hypothetical protein
MKNIQIFRRVLGAAFISGLLFATNACGDAADGGPSTSSYCAYDDLERGKVRIIKLVLQEHKATVMVVLH